jgi:hypothetical protein
LFAALAFGLFLQGSVLFAAIASGAWFRHPRAGLYDVRP